MLSLLQGVDPLLLMGVGEALSYQVDRSGSGGCWRLWCIGGRVLLGAAAIAPPSAASPERLARWLLTWLLLLLLTGLGRWVIAFRAVLGGMPRPGTCVAHGGLVTGVRVHVHLAFRHRGPTIGALPLFHAVDMLRLFHHIYGHGDGGGRHRSRPTSPRRWYLMGLRRLERRLGMLSWLTLG